MHWRNSPFFDRQFTRIAKGASIPRPFLDEVFAAQDDAALHILADWLEEQGDLRWEYIRRMCSLAGPLGELLSWARETELPAEQDNMLLRKTSRDCTIVACFRSSFSSDWGHQLSDELLQCQGLPLVVLDMRRVRGFGVYTVDVLATTARNQRQAGGDLCILLGRNQTLREVIELTRLNDLLLTDSATDTDQSKPVAPQRDGER